MAELLMSYSRSLTALIVGSITLTGGPALAQELDLAQPPSETAYGELPSASSFEELTAPQIDLDVIPDASLPPASPETTASISPKPVVKEDPSGKGDRAKSTVKFQVPQAAKPVMQIQPPVQANVSPQPAVTTPVPGGKPAVPAIPLGQAPSALSSDTDVITSTLDEIPVIGVELTPEDEPQPQPVRQQPASNKVDRN
ncbi:MAG: hypothetical protein ACR2OM_12450 [Aestuariivirgaceae bacterium]